MSATVLAGDHNMRSPSWWGWGFGVLVVLVDVMLKGFSLRGLSAITFWHRDRAAHRAHGGLVAAARTGHGGQPLDDLPDPARAVSGVPVSRGGDRAAGKDEFNLVIPYVRFVPHEVDVPLVVVDTSVLIDGRSRGCASRVSDGGADHPALRVERAPRGRGLSDPHKQARGRRGLEVLNELRQDQEPRHPDHRERGREARGTWTRSWCFSPVDAGKLLTTDYNLAKLAEFHGVTWLNLNTLAKIAAAGAHDRRAHRGRIS